MPRKSKNITKYTVKTVSKELVVSDGHELNIRLLVDEKHINILPSTQDEFVFKSANNLTTIKRWKMVIDGLQEAIKVLAKERNI